jgi:hypothetical protein
MADGIAAPFVAFHSVTAPSLPTRDNPACTGSELGSQEPPLLATNLEEFLSRRNPDHGNFRICV